MPVQLFTSINTSTTPYRGRFAPSPTGPLHDGSLVAALASWLDARAHHGQWLVRIEDIDPPRCQPQAAEVILQQLAQCEMHPDESPVWQSQRHAHYAQALNQLKENALSYPCGCTRKDIEQAWQTRGLRAERHVERPYPGICRDGLHGKPPRSIRFHLEKYIENWPSAPINKSQPATFFIVDGVLHWEDRRLGPQQQSPSQSVGDFVLQRADGLYSYQLAVVVDDALQGITHVVRGEDLADNTPRQLLLQHALHYPHPHYLHTPLVRMPDGEKLSKQHGAPPLDLSNPLRALRQAAQVLGLRDVSPDTSIAHALHQWMQEWQAFYNTARDRYSSNPSCH